MTKPSMRTNLEEMYKILFPEMNTFGKESPVLVQEMLDKLKGGQQMFHTSFDTPYDTYINSGDVTPDTILYSSIQRKGEASFAQALGKSPDVTKWGHPFILDNGRTLRVVTRPYNPHGPDLLIGENDPKYDIYVLMWLPSSEHGGQDIIGAGQVMGWRSWEWIQTNRRPEVMDGKTYRNYKVKVKDLNQDLNELMAETRELK